MVWDTSWFGMKKKHENGIITKQLQNSYMPMTIQRFKKLIFGMKTNPRRQTMKKRTAWFRMIGLLFAVVLWGSISQTGEDLFQKALRLERNEGKLVEAIELYNKVVAEGKGQSLAAQAQLRIGLCYEKLGQKTIKQAQEAFQKVVDNFPGEIEAVKMAQEKLSNFLKAQSAIEKASKEFNLRKIWSGPLTDTLGAPSPDGRYLSMVDWMTGDLAVRDLTTGKNRRLTDKGSWQESSEFALFSRWSPDGKKIVYNWLNKEECFELRIVEPDNPEPRILYPVGTMEYVHPFEWSPDGNNILALVTQAPRTSQIGLISVADGSFRVLKTTDNDWQSNLPIFTFSPDGRYIAFSNLQDEDTQNRDIFLMSVEDKQETVLIEHPMNDSLLGWSPDGKWILFASDRTGSTDAWIVRVELGKPIQAPEMIKKDLGHIDPMGFTQKGSFIYGVSNQGNDIYAIYIDPESGKMNSPPVKATKRYEGSNQSPAYSADGKYLAYVSTRAPRPIQRNVLCIRDLQTGKERELDPEEIDFNYPRWSPDGQFISVEGQDKEGIVGIYRIDVKTGTVDPIIQIEPGVTLYSHRWAKDGQSIFYTRSDPDEKGQNYLRKSHIHVHNIVNGQDDILTGSPDDAKDIDISPDGQWLALLNRTAKRVLRIMPTLGGELRALYSFEDMTNSVISPAWIAGGKYILFYKDATDSPEAESKELVRVPAEGGRIQRLGLKMVNFRHFSVHPDGQHIVFYSRGAKTEGSEVWVMENFLPKNEKKK
jgi:Tol biopolymer transport system component